MRSTQRTDADQAATPDQLAGRAQPLLGADDVVHALAGQEQRAEDGLDDVQVPHLSGTDRGQGLVEGEHSLIDPAGECQHLAEASEGGEFQVGVTARPADLPGLA